MWTRTSLKDYAKAFLNLYYWPAFLVCLITIILGGGTNLFSNNNTNNSLLLNNFTGHNEADYVNSIINFTSNFTASPLLTLIQSTSIIIIFILMVLLITVSFAVEVGQSRFFLEGFKGRVFIGTVFSPFNRREYIPIVKTILLRNIYNFLWFLLFIIPGIIKYYEYRFVPYILAEESDLTSNEVITKSRLLTKGQKLDMFLLDLSFLGWYILGAILCGLGVFFIAPYKQATYARLYNVLNENSV